MKKTLTVCDHCGTQTMGVDPSRVTIRLLANGRKILRDLCSRCTDMLINMIDQP